MFGCGVCVCSSTRERGSMCVVKSSRCHFQHMPMPKALWRWSGGSNRAMWCWCTARRKRWPTWSVPSYRISAFLRLIRPTARLSHSTARCAYLYRFQRHCCRCTIVELSFCFVDFVVCVCVCVISLVLPNSLVRLLMVSVQMINRMLLLLLLLARHLVADVVVSRKPPN